MAGKLQLTVFKMSFRFVNETASQRIRSKIFLFNFSQEQAFNRFYLLKVFTTLNVHCNALLKIVLIVILSIINEYLQIYFIRLICDQNLMT